MTAEGDTTVDEHVTRVKVSVDENGLPATAAPRHRPATAPCRPAHPTTPAPSSARSCSRTRATRRAMSARPLGSTGNAALGSTISAGTSCSSRRKRPSSAARTRRVSLHEPRIRQLLPWQEPRREERPRVVRARPADERGLGDGQRQQRRKPRQHADLALDEAVRRLHGAECGRPRSPPPATLSYPSPRRGAAPSSRRARGTAPRGASARAPRRSRSRHPRPASRHRNPQLPTTAKLREPCTGNSQSSPLVLLGFAAVSGRVEGTWVTAPIVFTAAGLVFGVEALGLVDPAANGWRSRYSQKRRWPSFSSRTPRGSICAR